MVYLNKGGRHAYHLDAKLGPLRAGLPGINHLEVREGLPFPPAAV